jgi:hypothetical protein
VKETGIQRAHMVTRRERKVRVKSGMQPHAKTRTRNVWQNWERHKCKRTYVRSQDHGEFFCPLPERFFPQVARVRRDPEYC